MVRKRKAAKLGTRAGVWAAPKAGRVAGKAGRLAGKAALRAAKSEAKLARAKVARGALRSREPAKARYLTYGLVALAGLVVGVLLGRSRNSGDSSYTAPSEQTASGSGGQTWGSGTPLGTAGSGAATVPEQQQDLENSIRTRIGEDPRTREMPRVNVEVIEGVAELRGTAPSEEAKGAAGEIAAGIEGVREVRNLLTISS